MEAPDPQAHVFDKFALESRRARGLCSAAGKPELAGTLQDKGWAFLKVSGRSMFPWIRAGDVVFVRHINMSAITRGDVIVFEKNSLLCVHRVISVDRCAGEANLGVRLITKGDATADADEPVCGTAFRGKVEFIYRRNREINIAKGWRSYLGRFLAAVSPAMGWWRRASSAPRHEVANYEFPGVPHVEVHRSKQSAD
jgi:signal peptidase I